jgi:hypothetical protein
MTTRFANWTVGRPEKVLADKGLYKIAIVGKSFRMEFLKKNSAGSRGGDKWATDQGNLSVDFSLKRFNPDHAIVVHMPCL